MRGRRTRALERFRRAALRGAERAPPPDKVARAVWRALNARRPPLRTVVTPHRLDRLSLWIPDRLLDWLIARFLWKKRLTPPAPASRGEIGRASCRERV